MMRLIDGMFEDTPAYASSEDESFIRGEHVGLHDKTADLENMVRDLRRENHELRLRLAEAEQIVLLPGENYAEKYGRRAEAPSKGPASIERPKFETDKKRAAASAKAQQKMPPNAGR